MAGCGGKKKYEEGGEVDKSKGVKGRTSRKAKKDQLNFQRGYAKGLSKAQRQFNIKGGVNTTEDEVDKAYRGKTKFYEGEVKGKSDMKEALKGQGAYKKGGKVKKMQDGGMTAAAAGSMPTKEELALLAQQRAAAMAAAQARAVPQRSRLGGVPGDMRALAPQGGASLGGMKKGGKVMNEGMKALKKEAPEVAAKMGYKKGGAMKKGYHKMPDGKMMKDSAHKGMKKGGMVKRDGCAVRGKTKGRMV
jgi:hypothetical protein